MRCRIRTNTRKGKDGIVHQDQEFEGERLTIGRGADRNVFLSDLRVALEHAYIVESSPGQFLITATAPSGIRLNSEVLSAAVLSPGDVLGIGNFEITVRKPKSGYDLRLDVEQVRTARGKELEEALKRRSKIGLDATHMRRRRWAWLGFIVVLGLFLAIPAAGFFLHHLRQPLRQTFVVSDLFWNPGALSSAHKFIGNDCNVCHQKAFQSVRDAACMKCHKNTREHTDPVVFAHANIAGTHCESCHKEHQNGRSFIRRDEALCSNCHENIKAIMAKTTLENVSDFGSGHPQFRPTLLSVVRGKTVRTRVSLDDHARLKEHSNLKFPHNKHLTKKGVKMPNGKIKVLVCADCHRPEPGGKRMQPIDFEKDCHSCHLLTFDKHDPQREVPHGKPMEVMFTLQEYYSSRALKGGYQAPDAPPVVRQLRRPGVALTPVERLQAVDWVRMMTRKVAREMFQFRTCAVCHTITPGPPSPDPEALPFWEVAPVRLQNNWMPLAKFDHSKHKTMACTDCHDAPKSKTSQDVLLDGIASCRKCHGGANSTTKLASTCVDCHGFHISKKFFMGASATEVAEARKRTAAKQ